MKALQNIFLALLLGCGGSLPRTESRPGPSEDRPTTSVDFALSESSIPTGDGATLENDLATNQGSEFNELWVEAIRIHTPRIRDCYETTFRHRPVEGIVELRIALSAQGDIASVNTVRNTTQDPELGECLAGAVRAFSIVGTPNTVFVFPFVFGPRR